MFHEGWSAEVDDYAIVCGWALGGKLFIVGDVGGGIYGFEGDTGKIIWKKDKTHSGGLLAMSIHPDGEIYYTAAREADYQTNILNGRFADSSLGRVMRQALLSPEDNVFADFQPKRRAFPAFSQLVLEKPVFVYAKSHVFNKNLCFPQGNHSFSMPDAELLCAIKWPDIGIHLGTIGLSREEKEEREKRKPGIEKLRKAGKSWKNLTCWLIFSENAGFSNCFSACP